jgi:HAD superfamily hydrolase (TIGR01484 family)
MVNSYLIAVVFALNRIFSTVLGVGISLFVNQFGLPKKKNTDILFVSSLDKAILNKNHQITGFTKYKINQLSGQGCKITFATTRTQASLNEIFNGIRLQIPLITMNGSAIYNPKERKYLSVDFIPQDVRHKLDKLFEERGENYFCHTVDDDVLQIYHGKLINAGEKHYYEVGRNSYFDNYVSASLPNDMNACFYVIIDTHERVKDIIKIINKSDYADKLDILYYDYDLEGYSFLKINSRNSNKYTRLAELKQQTNAKKIVVFGSGSSDIEMMQMADISLCLDNAPTRIKDVATYVLPTHSSDEILKMIESIFHKHDFEAYAEKLKHHSGDWHN